MILVTGASGFLGRHLLEALSRKGDPVRALYFRSKNLPSLSNVTWQHCDLSDVMAIEEAMENIHRVYNCAATVSFDPKDKNRLINDNVSIVQNIVNAALDAEVEKFVHVSSIAALGRKKSGNDRQLIDEKSNFDEGDSNSLYSTGKYYGELEVWRGMAEGLNAIIINPAVILGAGDWTKGSAKLMQVCYEEFPWFTKGTTAWVNVQDVARAMILLMESNYSGERYILSEGNHTYKDIFTEMALALNKRPPHKLASPLMTEIVWRLSLIKNKIRGTEATITKETARTAQQNYLYNNQKFLEAFPAFQYTPISQTIQEMANTFLKEKENN